MTRIQNPQLERALDAIQMMRVAELQCSQARRIRDDAVRQLVNDEGYGRGEVARSLGISTSLVKYIVTSVSNSEEERFTSC